MSFSEFEKYEDEFQKQFDDIQLKFEPQKVIKVELLGFRDISVGFSDIIDTPDPQFQVTCPKADPESLQSLKTNTIPNDITSGFVGETFKFAIPKDLPEDEPIPLTIQLSDRDVLFDDVIGEVEVSTSNLPADGTPVSMTLNFAKKREHGEVDIKISKYIQSAPDFRYSLGLCEGEKAFRKKRIPKTFEAMKKLLGKDAPKNIIETPVVSLVGSGGGYRAVVGMCGAMEALRDAGLLDVITYNCGLSGSSWYLAAAYAMHGVKENEQKEFHDSIRERMSKNPLWDMISLLTIKSYISSVSKASRKFGQPHTFANYFPGFVVGRNLLQKTMETKLSDMIPYIETAEVPYPLLIALQVKNHLKAAAYHAYLERTPYEISLPSYGIGVKPDSEGSNWSHGVMVKKNCEFPLHFTLAMTGCAFSILLKAFVAEGGEMDESFMDLIEEERLSGKKGFSKNPKHAKKDSKIDSSDEDDVEDEDAIDDGDDDLFSYIYNKNSEPDVASKSSTERRPNNEINEKKEVSKLQNLIERCPLFTSRNGMIGRTTRVFNVAYGLTYINHFLLNPLERKQPLNNGSQSDLLLKKIQEKKKKKRVISSRKNIICFVDAGWNRNKLTTEHARPPLPHFSGVLKNVPTDLVLRPQRATNLMIVMDFNAYNSDDCFDYRPLLSAAIHAWESGLEFPEIDFKKITNMPPKDFMIFPSNCDNCPTVLWFTLSNMRFKSKDDYKPKSTAKKPFGENRKFNDFQVFGKGTKYSTFNFHYENYYFDQLKELMHFNVTNHIDEIKEALISATVQKRQKFSKRHQN